MDKFEDLYNYIEDWIHSAGNFGISKYIAMYSNMEDKEKSKGAVKLLQLFMESKLSETKDLKTLKILIEGVQDEIRKAKKRFFYKDHLIPNDGVRLGNLDCVILDLQNDKARRAARYYATIMDDQDYANAIETRCKNVETGS